MGHWNGFFAARQAQGFNCIWVNLLEGSMGGDSRFGRSDGSTVDGIRPFTSGTDPDSYDLATPNPTFFARVDTIIQATNRYGHTLIINPAETILWLTTLENNGSTKVTTTRTAT